MSEPTEVKPDEHIATEKLTGRQEMFCQYYATDKSCFASGVNSYAEAYDLNLADKGNYNTAKANAHRLLTNAYILKRINELLELDVLNDEFVDKQLAFLINQNTELGTKLGALKEYNALKSRVTKKLELSGTPTIALVEFIDTEGKD